MNVIDDGVRAFVEINEAACARFKRDITDVSPDEIDWRPLPEANTINLIVRHLRIDAAWHVRSIERSDDVLPDAVPLDFERNLRELDELSTRFIRVLRGMTLSDLEQQTALAYKDSGKGSTPDHFLGFHFALHLSAHGAQIRTLRNLYFTTRGEAARFFPDNPTFPR